LGVTVVCCYITRRPIAEPRRLYSAKRLEWEEEAKFMLHEFINSYEGDSEDSLCEEGLGNRRVRQ